MLSHHHDHGDHGGHDHGHGHSHAPATVSPKRLIAVTALTLTIFFAELIGGLVSGSLALLADAGHMLTDAAGLLMALAAIFIGRKQASNAATYGYRRAEVFAALLNAISVLAIGVFIVFEAFRRFGSHTDINTTQMLIIAIIGLIANLIGMWVLADSAKSSVNIRGAYLHILTDAAGSVAVIVSALVISSTGWVAIDAVVSLLIAGLIVPRSIKLAATCVSILMERTPQGVNVQAIEADLLAIDDIDAVHDLHVWSVSGTETLLTAHIVLAEDTPYPDCDVLDQAQTVLRDKHNIGHSTLQIEPQGHSQHEPETCH